MNERRRHLRAVPADVPPVEADREISVRFTSTSALVARLEKPLNSFYWVGPATLHFSGRGVLITARRSAWLGLRQTQLFIAPADIRDVYREANEVQVHLHGFRNPYFRLWAENAASAAEIVALLPTERTIEFDTAISEPRGVIPWRIPTVVLVALAAVACLGVFAWWAEQRVRAVPAPSATQLPEPPPVAPTVKPEPPTTGEDALRAREDLLTFGARIEALSNEFKMAFEALQSGAISQEKFTDELEQWLRPQWDDLEARLLRANAPKNSVQERADRELRGAINNWQLALYSYAEDLRNQRQVIRSFEYLKRADQHLQQAQQLQSDLERSPTSAAQPSPHSSDLSRSNPL